MLVPFMAPKHDCGGFTKGLDMNAFQELLATSKAHVMAAIGKLDQDDMVDPNFAMAETTMEAMDEMVPEEVDASWCLTMLSQCPDLFGDTIEEGTLTEAVRGAVIDRIVDLIADDVEAHARSLGLLDGGSTPKV